MFSGHLVTKEWSFLKMCYTFLFFNNYSKFTDLFCDSNIYLRKKGLFCFFKARVIFLSMRENICFSKELLLWRNIFKMFVWKCFYHYMILWLKTMYLKHKTLVVLYFKNQNFLTGIKVFRREGHWV